METELERRIAELKEFCYEKNWESLEAREVCELKLARLELLYKDLTTFY